MTLPLIDIDGRIREAKEAAARINAHFRAMGLVPECVELSPVDRQKQVDDRNREVIREHERRYE